MKVITLISIRDHPPREARSKRKRTNKTVRNFPKMKIAIYIKTTDD